MEEYEENIKKVGEKRARRKLIWNAMKFIRPGIILRNKFKRLNHLVMLKSNLLIAFRQLMRNKTFSAINISGLSIGIVAFVLILQYVNFEKSYEDFHTNSRQIFRITLDFYKDSQLVVSDCEMFAPIGPLLKEKYPEVLDYVRLYEYGRREVKLESKIFLENKVYFADPSALSVFSFNLIHGDKVSALNEPFQVVVTELLARKYFNRSDVTGEIIYISNRPYKITGVIADLSPNTHLKIDLLLSHSTIAKLWTYDETDFCCNNEYTYVLMDQQAEVGAFNQKLKSLSTELRDKIGDGDEQLWRM